MPVIKKVKLTTENLPRLCWAKGFRGVAGLARKMGKTPATLWRAVRWPDQFGPTIKQLEELFHD